MERLATDSSKKSLWPLSLLIADFCNKICQQETFHGLPRPEEDTFLTVACSVEGTHWWRRHFSGHPTIPRERDGLLSLEGH